MHLPSHSGKNSRQKGYSLLELMIVVAIIGILALSVNFSYSPADSRLKSAARDLYSNLQTVRLGAVKTSTDWGIIFDDATSPQTYTLCSSIGPDGDGNCTNDGGQIELSVSLDDYESGTQFSAINYSNNEVIFTPQGFLTCNSIPCIGSVELTNNKGTLFKVGTTSLAGVVKIYKWSGTAWE